MFRQLFVSSQVKLSVIISNKQGIYHLPYQLPSDLTLRILGKLEIPENLKTSYNYSLVLSVSSKIKVLSILTKISCQIEIELFL